MIFGTKKRVVIGCRVVAIGVIMRSAVFEQYRRVTDGQTDRQTDRHRTLLDRFASTVSSARCGLY